MIFVPGLVGIILLSVPRLRSKLATWHIVVSATFCIFLILYALVGRMLLSNVIKSLNNPTFPKESTDYKYEPIQRAKRSPSK